MTRYVVKEFIIHYMKKRKLTPLEFSKICDISIEEFDMIMANSNTLNMEALSKISGYIHVPMENLYVDLDMENNQPILSEYDLWLQSLENDELRIKNVIIGK